LGCFLGWFWCGGLLLGWGGFWGVFLGGFFFLGCLGVLFVLGLVLGWFVFGGGGFGCGGVGFGFVGVFWGVELWRSRLWPARLVGSKPAQATARHHGRERENHWEDKPCFRQPNKKRQGHSNDKGDGSVYEKQEKIVD